MDAQLRDHIENFIGSQYVMVLAVAQNNIPYTCTVWYVTDDFRTLYFKSRTASNHSNIIVNNPHVAVAIYDHQSTYEEKRGIQIQGTVNRVTELVEVRKVVAMYTNAFEGAGDKIHSLTDLISYQAKSSMYKLTITHVKMVDTQFGILIDKYQKW